VLAAAAPDATDSGDVELSFQLITDHGEGGTSEMKVAYTGLSQKDADGISGMLKQAINGVLGVVQGAAPSQKPAK
jgi:hypothetical protein